MTRSSLLRVRVGQLIGDDEPAAGEDDALGRLARGLYVLDVAEAMALEELLRSS